MPTSKNQRIEQLKQQTPQISPTEAFQKQKDGAILIDVRSISEIAIGSPVHALRLGRDFLEFTIEKEVPDHNHPIMIICATGMRSLFAAESLRSLGYTQVMNVMGGTPKWKYNGLPMEEPLTLDSSAHLRYAQHLDIPEIGEEGQLQLLNSRVLIVGTGGTGCAAAFYLAAAGIGKIGLVDHAMVDISNLQRQILYSSDTIGLSKVTSARATLSRLNPDVDIANHEISLDSSNAEKLFADYDIVIDGSDNLAARYLINDVCVKLGLPNVHASVHHFSGQVTVFWPAGKTHPSPCYRCLHPEPPTDDPSVSFGESGTSGFISGMTGSLQGAETIKVLLNIGQPLIGRSLRYDSLNATFQETPLSANTQCSYCQDPEHFPGYIDYEDFCDI
jgi:sulfur-carrier protein adenylyltransferase/sulfurtransferase